MYTALLGDVPTGVGILSMIIPFVLLAVFFYFMILRPQRKEQAQKQALMESLEVGDSIVTTSGFYGVIIDVMDDIIIVEFGNNKNCRIPMKKMSVAEVEKAKKANM